MASAINPIDKIILERLYDRPSWLRSLQHVKPRVEVLRAAGYVRRVKPPTGTATNMVEITPAGAEVIEAYWRSKGGK